MEPSPDVHRAAEPTPSAEPLTLPGIVTHKVSNGAYEVLTPINSAAAGEVELGGELETSEDQINFVAIATLIRLSNLETTRRRTASREVVTIVIHWWGYEIALPPPALAKLERARSIQQTFFWFLQGFIAAGGEEELFLCIFDQVPSVKRKRG